MHGYVAELTKKTHEIKSSDGEQLGAISNILNNRILMTVSVGRIGQFVIPEKMIDNIRKGTVYLALTKKEFEKWWVTEGLKLKREYEKDPDIALGRRVVGDDLLLLRNNIGTAFEAIFGRKIHEDRRQRLCSEQEDLRISLPAQIRDKLDSDEWVYRCLKMSEREEDFFVITSKRLTRLSSGYGKWFNWTIPIDKIESISVSHEDVYWVPTESGLVRSEYPPLSMGSAKLGGHLSVLRIKYRAKKDLQSEELYLPSKAYYSGELRSIKEFIEDVIDSKGKRQELHVGISESVCPSCGYENPSDAKFCVTCGRELK